ncbi:MAG TPA: type I 3-dehydroquinate dehydratase, partial [Planctomycetota bacterium]|nr:type I 3-dehydroquinate dehydratase [Planctomycetota bacterium]
REQGGAWEGDETRRVALLRDALARGAAMVDVELGSPVSDILLRENREDVASQVLVSFHDFDRTPGAAEIDRITTDLERLRPRAIKLVTTARSAEDAARMIAWNSAARPDGPRRIGFAMGERGLPSRVLAVAHGAAYTYGALGDAVAPGQPSVADLVTLYRVPRLGSETVVYGVAGNPVGHSLSPHMHNPALAAAEIDAVYLPFLLESLEELDGLWNALRLRGLSVTIPLKEEAFRIASERDERSARARASNTLVVARAPIAGEDEAEDRRIRPTLRAFNTDFDGVLGPLRTRLEALEGVAVAVLGNGGAARGAVEALKDAGAKPMLVYRNIERGTAVARELGVPGTTFSELDVGRHEIIVNATSLGLDPGDPSPLAGASFRPGQIVFDMTYGRETALLRDARAAGAKTIDGGEMLVAQGLVQFELFTGQKADAEVFARCYRDGLARRTPAPKS